MRCAMLVAILALANGFVLTPFAARSAPRAFTSMNLESQLNECLADGCSVDTVEDLIAELKNEVNSMDMKLPLSPREKQIVATIKQLEHLGADGDKNEVEKIIAAASRSFSVVEGFDFPGEPLGYSGSPTRSLRADKVFD